MRFMTLVCTLVINGIMAVQFGKRASQNKPITNPDFDEKSITFFSLAVIHLVLTSGLIVLWFLLESRLANIDGWRCLLQKWRKDIVFSANRNKKSETDLSVMDSLRKNFYQLDLKERYRIVSYRNALLGYPDAFHKLEYWVRSWIFVFYDPTIMSLWRFLLASIIGLYFQTQGFLFGYSILMLDVIYWFKTMQNVIFSITFNGSQLALAFLLGKLVIIPAMIVAYNYSLFAFFYVDDTFFNKNTGSNLGENICVSVFQCFLTVLSLGPRSSGAIGDVLTRQSYEDGNLDTFWVRWVFDFTNFA